MTHYSSGTIYNDI